MTTRKRAGRRSNNEGSFTFLEKSGLWQVRISHEGKRIAAYGRTKEEAREKLRALQRKQDQGLPLVTSKTPMRDYLTQWLGRIQHQVRPSTHAGYEGLVRVHLIPRLGHIKLGKLSPEHIERAYAAMLAEGKSASVIEHVHLRLSKALNDAIGRRLIYWNPAQAITPPKPSHNELHPPDASDINRLLDTAAATEYYEAIHTAFYTGLRRNELLALRWRDLDLDMARLSVSRSLYRAKGGKSIYQDAKTTHGRRLVSLTPSSALVLRSLRDRQRADGLLQDYPVDEESLVFRYRDGSPILPRGFSGAFRKILRRAGLEGYRLHDARHAHATQMLRQGVHPLIVSQRLGHSRVGITLDTYSHVTPGLQEAAALRFEEGLIVDKAPEREPIPGVLA